MILRANCKINLGLDVLRRRADGYHDLETAMFPVRGLFDEVEVLRTGGSGAELRTEGIAVDCAPEENICMKAFRLMRDRYGVDGVVIRLVKRVPFGAGLGGGSSDGTAVLKALLGVAPMYWLVGIIEVLTYVPMLGTGGTYLGFVTGNLTNLKVPCALNAMQAAKVKAGTEEGEVISTIAIASSSIVTVVVIAIGVFGLRLLEPVLESPVLKPAFDNILPSLFGALGVVFVSKNPKIAAAPMLFMVVLFLLVPSLSSSVSVLVPVGALIAIGAARLLYRKGMIGTEKESGNK